MRNPQNSGSLEEIINNRAEEIIKFIEERGLNLPQKEINRIIKRAIENLLMIKREQPFLFYKIK